MRRHCSVELLRFIQQVGKYQEQPQLLDPLLEGIVTPLTALLRAAAEDPPAADLLRVRAVARLLWQLSIVRWANEALQLLLVNSMAVQPQRAQGGGATGHLAWQLTFVCPLAMPAPLPRRGYKTVLRFFPNDVPSFEPVVALLSHVDVAQQRRLESATGAPRLEDGAGFWEVQVRPGFSEGGAHFEHVKSSLFKAMDT